MRDKGISQEEINKIHNEEIFNILNTKLEEVESILMAMEDVSIKEGKYWKVISCIIDKLNSINITKIKKMIVIP